MNRATSILELEHLQDAYKVWLSAGWNDAYALGESEFVNSWMASPVKVGTWVDGQLIAIGRANTDHIMYSMIHDVVVAPPFRGNGHGSAIVRELLNILKGMKVRSIQLMSAKGQVPFYEALGFRSRPHDGPGMEYDWSAS